MEKHALHQQRELSAGIQMSDVRTKPRSDEDALGIVRQYDLILGFLQYIKPILDDYPELNTFYCPIESTQLLCVYRTADLPQAVPVEFRTYQVDARLRARKLFDQTTDERYSSYQHPQLDVLGYHDSYRHEVIDLILAVLGGHLPRQYPKGTTSLVVPCSIPEQITAASSRLRDLAGILILFGDKQSFPQSCHSSLAENLKRAFNNYFAETGQFAIRELEFFLSSLMNQDERIQDNQNRALGFIAHMVVHRFRNFRQVAEFIGEEFPAAKEVAADPDFYEDKIRAMKSQLNRAKRLEKQLEYIGQTSQKTRLSISELLDIFNYVFADMQKQTNSSVLLDLNVSDDLLKEHVNTPQSMLEEVFYNHMENMFRYINYPGVEDKKLTLKIYPEAKYICADLINYGPPLSPDTLEDLQRTVRVRRPSGSGLGMFLSTMIMRHIGGDQEVISPIPDSDKGVCITLKFPR